MNMHDTNAQGNTLLTDEMYQALIGHYHFASGREILLTRKGLGEAVLYFYAEGDTLVRISPRSATQFSTDRGETLTFPGGQAQADLLLQDAEGRPHEARRVQSYEEELVQFAGSDQHTLSGSLLKPPGLGSHPAVLLYHLANVHERDYYRIYAQHFVRHGIAALIYDKRGHGASTGEPLSSQIFELIEDADAAFRFVQSHPDIDAHRVGAWGMSNGGWVDLSVATRHPEIAFVLNLSASGVPPSRQEQIRRVNVSCLLGAQPEELRFLETFWELAFKFLIHAEWTDDLETALQHIQHEPEWRYLLPDTESAWLFDTSIAEIKSEYGGAWSDGGFDPAPLYAQLCCPVLCLWGEDDTVLPVAESATCIQKALQASSHPDWTLRTFPKANHLLYLNRTSVDEPTNEAMHEQLHDIQFPAGLFEFMTMWAIQRLQPL